MERVGRVRFTEHRSAANSSDYPSRRVPYR